MDTSRGVQEVGEFQDVLEEGDHQKNQVSGSQAFPTLECFEKRYSSWNTSILILWDKEKSLHLE